MHSNQKPLAFITYQPSRVSVRSDDGSSTFDMKRPDDDSSTLDVQAKRTDDGSSNLDVNHTCMDVAHVDRSSLDVQSGNGDMDMEPIISRGGVQQSGGVMPTRGPAPLSSAGGPN